MDVAGAVARGLRQQRIEHADDGRVVRGFQQVLDRRQILHHARQIGVALDLADHGGGARFTLRVGRADALNQGLRAQRLQLVHRVFAHDFAHRAGARVGMHAQCQVTRLVLQQQLVGAGKGVGQRVAHGSQFRSGLREDGR